MLEGYRVYDADAHAMFGPRMWEDLPAEYAVRRPRPVRVADEDGLGGFNTSWLTEGRLEPHPYGPGAQEANTPWHILKEFGAPWGEKDSPISSLDLSDPEARLRDLDRMGIDAQVLFPTTLYAKLTSDPGFEAALYRAYNRYMGRQCKSAPKRLKWAALLPLREPRQAFEAIEEMRALGAAAAVVYGTVGERLLSDPSFTPVWDEFYRTGLPLCVHMGMSYPAYAELCRTTFDGHVIGMSLPAQLGFIAIVGQGMLDRYPDLKVAFLEFGAEWLLYMVGRMDHYLAWDRAPRRSRLNTPMAEVLPQKRIEDYVRSGKIFVAPEMDDRYLHEEMELVGEEQILFSSDFPHGEGRENAALEVLHRRDLTEQQKRKLFYDNTVRLFGEP